MKKRDKLLSWLIGISLIIIIILVYMNIDRPYLTLIGSAVALASAIICWSLALKVKASGIVAYAIGFVFGLFGLVGYLIYYYFQRRYLDEERALEVKEKEKMDKKLGIETDESEKK